MLRRRGRGRPVAAVIAVPGQWIRVPMPEYQFPVRFSFDGGPQLGGYIDHELDPEGRSVSIAAIRCPRLEPGEHDAVLHLPDNRTIDLAVTVQ